MTRKLIRGACVFALLVLAAFGLLACPQATAPCATAPVADYLADMVKAGCTGTHFNDPQCAAIKAKRDASEADAGCK